MRKTRMIQMTNWAVEAVSQRTPSANGAVIDDIIDHALAEPDEDLRWNYVAQLHRLASREVVDSAIVLCDGATARERALGADILAQICGADQHPSDSDSAFYEERLGALLHLLGDKSVSVLVSAACGLGHMDDPRAIDQLVGLKGHASRRVRFAVVFGLLGFTDERAINALIDLSQDKYAEIRDWSTFGLGSLIDVSSSEICDALAARIGDTDYETRCEAIVGLARRKDPRAVAPLIEDLDGDAIGMLSLEAAAELADPALLPALLELKEHWVTDGKDEDEWDVRLADAIASCGGAPMETGT